MIHFDIRIFFRWGWWIITNQSMFHPWEVDRSHISTSEILNLSTAPSKHYKPVWQCSEHVPLRRLDDCWCLLEFLCLKMCEGWYVYWCFVGIVSIWRVNIVSDCFFFNLCLGHAVDICCPKQRMTLLGVLLDLEFQWTAMDCILNIWAVLYLMSFGTRWPVHVPTKSGGVFRFEMIIYVEKHVWRINILTGFTIQLLKTP